MSEKFNVKAALLLLAFVWMLIPSMEAQSLSSPSMTYFGQFDLKTTTDPVYLNFYGGDHFSGTKWCNILNGKVTMHRFNGTYTKADGTRYITQSGGSGFEEINNQFGFYNGDVWCLTTDNKLYKITFKNGQEQATVPETRTYTIDGDFIKFPQTYSGGGSVGGYVNGGGYYDGGGSTNSTSTSSNKTMCRGCNGSGSCQHCHGSGYENNYKSKCSLCHGTGKCVSCHGMGFIR